MKLSLIINGVEVDMFQDETIVINKTIQDVKDISKQFSDYTQSFTIPASPNNNNIFSHYYDLDLDSTFNQHLKADATLSFDGVDLLNGTIEFEGANVENNKPYSYNIVFYGSVASLSTEMAEDELSDIDWTTYDHTLIYSNIKNSWNLNLKSGDIVYPLFDTGRDWIWSNGLQTEPENINVSTYATTNTEVYSGIIIDELKPSIRLPQMIRAIFSHYGYTVESDFLDDADTQQMYVHLQKDGGKALLPDSGFEGNIKYDGNVLLPTSGDVYMGVNLTTLDYDSSGSFNISTQEFTAQYTGLHYFVLDGQANNFAGQITANYKVEKNGINAQTQAKVSLSGTNKNWSWTHSIYLKQGDKLKWFTRMNFGVFTNNNIDTTLTLKNIEYNRYGESVNLGQYMPSVKTEEFISKFLKMFNLVIEPLEGKVFKLEPIEDWYNGGSTYDFNEFIDVTSKDISKVAPYKRIKFKHSEDKSKSATLFKNIASREFGNKTYSVDVDFGVDELLIESPFVIPVPETLNALTNSGSFEGDSTGLVTHKYLDESGKPLGDTLTLSYYVGTGNCNSYYLQSGLAAGQPTFNQETIFPNFSIFNSNTPITSDTNTLSYVAEQPISTSINPTNTLYERFWSNYIYKLYDNETRVLSVESILPIGIFLNLRLRDSLSYDGQLFTINKLSYDFLTEKAKLELVTRDLTKKNPNGIISIDPPTKEMTFKTTPTNRELKSYNGVKGLDGKYYWQDFSEAVGSKQAELESSTTGLSNTAIETFVNKSGDTMTGALILEAADPATEYTAASKKYVDDSVGNAGGGDMLKTVYDPEGLNAQIVGVDSTQSITNKTVNGVTLTNGGSGNQYLTDDGTYSPISGGGDMLSSMYDPQGIDGDAFDVDNHTDGTTNKVFTALDNTKLDGIEALAEVNNISDVNATDLTDGLDSSLHFHSSDRDRANHTGSQTSSTISDFSSSVSSNSSVAANTTHRGLTTNPHSVSKGQVGLGSVDNTSDLDKPISNDTQIALDLKANTSSLADVGISGDYADLINKPTTITAQQASDILDNNAKVGITTSQANAIVNNTAKVSYTDAALVATHTTDIGANASDISSLETNKVDVSGDTMTGALLLHTNNPAADAEAASKKYVDDSIQQAGGYNDEQAQDAVGNILVDTTTIGFSYNDSTPSISAGVKSSSIDTTRLSSSVNTSLGLANSSVQPADLSPVATSGVYADLTGKPTTITTAQANEIAANTLKISYTDGAQVATNTSDISTIQGEQAVQDGLIATNTAKVGITPQQSSDITTNNAKISYTDGATVNALSVQVSSLQTVAYSADYNDLINKPTIPPTAPVDSVNSQTGVVVLTSDDIDDSADAHKFVSAAERQQISDNLSSIDNLSIDVNANSSDIQTNGVNIAANTSAIITNATNISNLNGTNIPTSSGGSTSITDALNQLDIDVLNAVKRQNHTGTQLASTISDFAAASNRVIGGTQTINDNHYVAEIENNSILIHDNGDDYNIILDSNSGTAVAVGFKCTLVQANSGLVVFNAGAGATIISINSAIETAGQGSMVHIAKIGTNTWCISGDLA